MQAADVKLNVPGTVATGNSLTEKKFAESTKLKGEKKNVPHNLKFAKGVTGESMAASLNQYLDEAYAKTEKMTKNSKKIAETVNAANKPENET